MSSFSRLLLLILMGLCVPLAASATVRYVSVTGANTNAGTNTSPWRTIQFAISTSATVNGDTIIVKNGHYAENVTITKSVTVASLYLLSTNTNDINNTIINGGDNGSVVTISANATLKGFYISNGGDVADGGGIYVFNCDPTLSDLQVRNNWSSQNGGGIFMASANPILSNVTVHGNTSGMGAGVHIANSNVQLSNITMSMNTASSYGGGMYIENSQGAMTGITADFNGAGGSGGGLALMQSNLTVSDLSAGYNMAGNLGGGVLIGGSNIDGSVLEAHHNSALKGGGFYIDGGDGGVDSLAADYNDASQDGGGIYINAGGNFGISTFSASHNTAGGNGGGIYLQDFNAGVAMPQGMPQTGSFEQGFWLDGAVNNNSVGMSGGGIYAERSQFLLSNVSVGLNTASQAGGGFYMSAGFIIAQGLSVTENSALSDGGGMFLDSVIALMANATVSQNTSDQTGGGIYALKSHLIIGGEFLGIGGDSIADISWNRSLDGGGGINLDRSNIYAFSVNITHNRSLNGSGGGVDQFGFAPLFEGSTDIGSIFGVPLGFTNCNISNNSAGFEGGGLSLATDAHKIPPVGEAVTPESDPQLIAIDGCEISHNRADSDGGGISADFSLVKMTNSTVHDNSSYQSYGGGIAAEHSRIIIDDCNIHHNSASQEGGGVYSEDSDFYVLDSEINYNRADYDGGGVFQEGIFTEEEEPLPPVAGLPADTVFAQYTLGYHHTDIQYNFAEGNGGGMYSENTVAILANSSVSENSCLGDLCGCIGYAGGGGIFAYEAVIMLDSTNVDDNKTDYEGGGLLLAFSDIFATSASISNNISHGVGGGGVFHDGVFEMESRGLPAIGSLVSGCPEPGYTDSRINDNTADGDGGGIFMGTDPSEDPLQILLSNTTVNDNSCRGSGAGIYMFNTEARLITDSESGSVSDNHACGNSDGGCNPGGGGIFAEESILLINGIEIEDNVSREDGGGMLLLNTTVYCTSASISYNEARGNGGGVYQTGASEGGQQGNQPAALEAEEGFDGIAEGYTDTEIEENSACGDGGGIYAEELCELMLVNSTVSHNSCGGNGGGMYVWKSQLYLDGGEGDDMEIEDNAAHGYDCGGDGGGLYLECSDLYSTGIQLGENTAARNGGGIYQRRNYSGGINLPQALPECEIPFGLNHASIIANTADNAGGGVWAEDVEGFTLKNSEVKNNATSCEGGAGLFLEDICAVLSNITVSGNTAAFSGGGMMLVQCDLTVRNALISGNTAYDPSGAELIGCYGGGGVWADCSPKLVFINSTFTGNWTSYNGGALLVKNGPGIFLNDIFWNNDAEDGDEDIGECSAEVGSPGTELEFAL